MLRMTDRATAFDPTAAEHDAALYKEGRQKTASFAKTSLGWLLMTLGSSIILVAVITVLSLALPKAAGLRAYVVVSGSMEPEYPVNCVVYAEKTGPSLSLAAELTEEAATLAVELTLETERLLRERPLRPSLIRRSHSQYLRPTFRIRPRR